MKLIKSAFIATIVAGMLSTSALAETCKVTDPTNTPLNARATPNGKIIGKLQNGRVIYISDIQYDKKGKAWAMAFDARTDRYLGWVYRDYISCYYN